MACHVSGVCYAACVGDLQNGFFFCTEQSVECVNVGITSKGEGSLSAE